MLKIQRPDIIHQRIIRSQEFLAANSEGAFNEQQICWSIVVFMFAYWDEEIRPRIAKIRGIAPDAVKVDALGDLRILRNSIVHNRGVLSEGDHGKIKVMRGICTANAKLAFSHDQMHKLFVAVKQAIASLMLEYTGHLPGAPQASEITDIAIQYRPR